MSAVPGRPKQARTAAEGEGSPVRTAQTTPGNAPVPAAALASLLRDAQADLADYDTLAQLLEQQFEGALRYDAAQLHALAQQINPLLDALDLRRRARVTLVTQLLGPQTPASMASLFERLPAARRAPVQALWDRLEQAVIDCKTRNARNARLMTEQQALLQRVLHGEQEPLYADV